MVEPVSLETAKAHLNLDAAFVADDAYISGLIVAARRKIELDTRRTFGGDTTTLVDDDARLAAMAILLTLASWYANREAVTAEARTTPIELPLSVSWIVETLQAWDDGS